MSDSLDPAAYPPQPYPPGGDPAVLPPPPPPDRGESAFLEPRPVLLEEPWSSAVERLENTVTTAVASIAGELRDKLALDRFREDQISRLHEELQAYKNDLISRASRQILQGVIRLHDDLGKVAASLRQRPAEELTPERFFQLLAGFQDDVELLLGQHGVERFEVEGSELDPRRQTALRTVPVDDSAQVGRIAERLRPGFLQGETLLQKERVAVYVAANAKD